MKKIMFLLLNIILFQQINAQVLKKINILPENLIEGMSFGYVDSLNPILNSFRRVGCNTRVRKGNVGQGDYIIFDFKSLGSKGVYVFYILDENKVSIQSKKIVVDKTFIN